MTPNHHSREWERGDRCTCALYHSVTLFYNGAGVGGVGGQEIHEGCRVGVIYEDCTVLVDGTGRGYAAAVKAGDRERQWAGLAG